ncbi:IS66 family insertion sequence element accessory protein TnpB [Chakrabartyella piscis]|uniref:IS66 family insertion sequence element accessory protein TnpB n=1 Tax=Chakrabartyella piscis TaxID=2918914 RepID=UPI0029589ACA|nr:IS66 family insertion sequence element accessory protein TnpB [Chakrabartyella piscis]
MGDYVCQCCGVSFTPTCHKTRQKYCSRECRIKKNNAMRYYGGQVDICLECGEPLEQSGEKGRWKRYCSESCRRAYQRRKAIERRQNRPKPVKICPYCGKEFVSAQQGDVQRFCQDSCRIAWWKEYHKAHPVAVEETSICLHCNQPFQSKKWNGGQYCSRDCYVQAMGNSKEQVICQYCGAEFTAYIRQRRKYCSSECAHKALQPAPIRKKGSHRICYQSIDQWKEELTEACKGAQIVRAGKKVRLVCGDTSMYIGLDGLLSIIQYDLGQNPYDGCTYAFCDRSGSMIKYIVWDGASFCQSKRRAQSGTYPWPKAEGESFIEISMREFEYLLTKSIVPTKPRKYNNTAKSTEIP